MNRFPPPHIRLIKPAPWIRIRCWLALSTLAVSVSASTEVPAPADLERKSQAALEKVKAACVSVDGGSGVIISPEGLVLTAAHIFHEKRFLQVELDDGRKAFAVPVGADRAADVGLVKMAIPTDTFESVDPATLTPREMRWPHAELAQNAPGVGAFCFVMGHPDARRAGRPAQFRLGRITHLHPDWRFLDADCTIQPGDSGCGLFDLEGRVVGIGVHATPYPGANTFAPIDAFHAGRDRMERGEIWGEPGTRDEEIARMDQDVLAATLKLEFEKVMGTDLEPRLESFIDTNAPRENGRPSLTPLVLAGALDYVAMAALRGVPYGLGVQDPQVVGQWPATDTPLVRPVRVYANPSLRSFGLPVSGRHLVVKWSLFPDLKSLHVEAGEEVKMASFINGDGNWDLALFDLGEELLTPVKFAEVEVSQAQALASPDANGVLTWGVACDVPRKVERAHAVGPFYNPELISRYRAPYRRASHHSLPLLARDAGRPLYNLNGECVGVHVARFSRSSGLFMAGGDVNALYRQWIQEGPKPNLAYPKTDLANPRTNQGHALRDAIERTQLRQAALVITFYLEANEKLPPSLDAVDGWEEDIKGIREGNKKYGIQMIYLSDSAKVERLEDLAATPVIMTPRRNGEHTVAYADGRVERVSGQALEAQLKEAGIALPPGATAGEEPDTSNGRHSPSAQGTTESHNVPALAEANGANAKIRVDQSNLAAWTGGWTAMSWGLSQTFQPGLPVLTGVDLDIRTANPHRGDDTIAVEILKEGKGIATASQLATVGFEGLLHFDLHPEVVVNVGETYVLRARGSKDTFGWKYSGDTYAQGIRYIGSNAKPGSDWRFQFYGLRQPISPAQ